MSLTEHEKIRIGCANTGEVYDSCFEVIERITADHERAVFDVMKQKCICYYSNRLNGVKDAPEYCEVGNDENECIQNIPCNIKTCQLLKIKEG